MPLLGNLTLRKKVSLFVMLGLVIGFGLFSWVGLEALDASKERALQERLTFTRLLAGHVNDSLGHVLAQLDSVATTEGLYLAEDDSQSDLQAVDAALSRLGIFTKWVFLSDERRQVLWSPSEGLRRPRVDLFMYPPIKEAWETGRSSISDLVLTPESDTPVVFLTSPVIQGGEVLGVLSVAIDVSQSNIGSFTQSLPLGTTGYAEIVDGNGVVIARTEPGHVPQVFEQSDHPRRFAELIREGEPTLGTCHRCHEAGEQLQRRKDVLAFVPLSSLDDGEDPIANWGVAVRQAEEEALAPTMQLRTRLVALGAIMLALALVFVWVTTRNILKPIRMLTSASRRIASGDLSGSISVEGKDEVSTLARTFDEMRVKLRDSREEIERWNRELEDRVHLRTREISCLLEVAKTIASTLELDSLLRVIVARVIELLEPADSGCLLLYDTKLNRLTTRSSSGEGSNLLFLISVEPGETLLGKVFKSGKAALYSSSQEIAGGMEDMVKHYPYSSTIAETISRARSAVAVPLKLKGQSIGVLFLMNFQQLVSFSKSDVPLVQAIADQISLAIENAQLLKEADEARALREADKVKSQFISTVSHELRTPLASIKGYSTSLLREDAHWDEQTKGEFLRIIDEKTDELRDLIDKLLQMSKMEAGALNMEKEPVLLPRLARKVVEELASHSKSHRFEVDFPATFPVVEADTRYVEWVLQNLIENAVKYSPEGGEVTVRGEVRDGMVVVGVSDEGVGISPEDLEKIFQRFYRVDNELTRHISGSGLGLSIARGLVEAHGGGIWVESDEGQGSTFYFSLPSPETHLVEEANGATSEAASRRKTLA